MPFDPAPILFYDGECGLCHRAVRWTIKHDRSSAIRFAPLQGETYAAIDDPTKPRDLSTMALLEHGRLLLRGDAVLAIWRRGGGAWPALAAVAGVVPRPLRDAAYRFVARRRLAWFGTVESCELPEPSSRARFLP